MSVKGSQVRWLLIKKKPVQAGDLKDARGGGFEAIHGTVSGSGSELCFEIAASDGFSSAPGGGKVDKLKKFLGEQTGKPITPTWKVVPKPTAMSPESGGEPTGTTTPDPAAKLMEALRALRPSIEAAVSAQPERKAEVVAALQKITDEIEGGAFDAAKTDLVAFGKLLQSLAEPAPGGDFDKLWPPAKAAWQAASDTVDEQISRMQAAMRESDLEELVRIAEFGFNGISGNFKVPLMAAIRNIDGSSGDARRKHARDALTVPEPDHDLSSEEKANRLQMALNAGNHEMQQLNTGNMGFKLMGVSALDESYGDEGGVKAFRGTSKFVGA
jgi:hypothetical protein